ncbi:MAG: hypothetical protein LBU16_09790 [Treponema sp.]|jgi:hypothetical protein|nr:hypothetical protein [Treponema sp.]
MAMNAEFLTPFFDGIENGAEQVGKILAEHEDEVFGLKSKERELLGKIDEHKVKQETLVKEKNALEAQYKELDEKLKANLPDKERHAYEAEIEKHKTNATAVAVELNKQLEERDGRIKALEADHHRYVCHAEFDSLINADPSIIPELRGPLKKLFFADNEFDWVEFNGERQLRNNGPKGSKQMKDVISDYLNTPEGQHFRVSKNNGGGASGSSGRSGNGNSVSRQQYDAMTAKQQSEYIAKGGQVV